jgi:hypothetical protein
MLPGAVDKTKLQPGEDKLAAIIERQVSYFADEEALEGLICHLREDNKQLPPRMNCGSRTIITYAALLSKLLITYR